MGLLKGNLTFFRLRYQGEFPVLIDELTEKLEEFSFEKVFDELKFVNYGFVPFNYPEIETFKDAELIFDAYFVFSFRMDEKKINKGFFDIEFEKAKKKFLQEAGKEKLSKTDVEFLKNSINNTLIKKSVPATTIVELIVDVNTSAVFLSKLNSKIFDAVNHFFKAAFDVVVYKETFIETVKREVDELSIVDELLQCLPTEI